MVKKKVLLIILLVVVILSLGVIFVSGGFIDKGFDCESPVGVVAVSNCLVMSVEPVFVFRYNPDNIVLSDQQLLSVGGDCNDWSKFYVSQLRGKGFNAVQVLIDMKGFTHAVAVVGDNNSYCLIDQLFVNCWDVKK